MKKHTLVNLQDIPRESMDKYLPHMRQLSVLLNNYLLKYLNSLYAEFGGDIVKAIVLGELAHHNISKMRKNGSLSAVKALDMSSGNDIRQELVPGNPFSISEATGIPRETVRRKFLELMEEGLVEKDCTRNYVITSRAAERFMHSFNLQLIEETNILCAEMRAVIYNFK